MKKGDYSFMAVISFALLILSFIWLLGSLQSSSSLHAIILIILLVFQFISAILGLIQIKRNKGLKGEVLALCSIIFGLAEVVLSFILTPTIY